MKWQYKARIQNAIAALPLASDTIYYAVQRTLGGLSRGRLDPLSRLKGAADMISWAESVGFELRGKTVLEIGTGRMVDLPTGMWLCGAERIVTVDLNRYLSLKLVSEARNFIRQNPEKVATVFAGRNDVLFQKRFEMLIGTDVRDDDLLRAMHIEYLSPADASNLPLDADSIDLHVSYAVMEHIPPRALSEILLEARRVIRAGGVLIHTIDPSDHFSHDDPAISKINFLQFTDDEWERLAGNKFMYHNRLRANDLVRIFLQAGVNILDQSRSVDERSLEALKSGFPLDQRFVSLPDEDLATTTLSILGSFERAQS